MSIEAMKQAANQAIKVFDNVVDHLPERLITDCINSAIALRQAIKQAEKQEPVAYVNDDGFIVEKDFLIAPGEKLYLAPPKREWVGLTDDEIESVISEAGFGCENIARAIETKLKEKNT